MRFSVKYEHQATERPWKVIDNRNGKVRGFNTRGQADEFVRTQSGRKPKGVN